MTAITAAMVKELRERTDAPMMECKKALTATNGDIEAAIKKMREEGQAKAEKKAGRTAAEGVIVIKVSDDNKKAVMVEINSETDFVSRDDNFSKFANEVGKVALSEGCDTAENLLAAKLGDDTVDSARKALITKIGENINVRRVANFKTDGHLGVYVHGGRIGVVVEITGGDTDLARDLAMHVAALSPLVALPEEVPEDVLTREKEIFVAQARESGKPDEIIEKMITGRMRKFLEEVSLTGQAFVKDPSKKVADLLKENDAKVIRFTRFEVGEGIEKETVDFATEVMQQAKG